VAWVDNQNRQFVPGEFNNVGGKTKWYGAALLRFSPHEFEADTEQKLKDVQDSFRKQLLKINDSLELPFCAGRLDPH